MRRVHDAGMVDLQLLHLVARTAGGARPFHARTACADLWNRITRSFDVVACVLMPDHVHLLAHIDADTALRAFARVLSAFRLRTQTTRPDLAFDWERLPQPEKVQNDTRHIARTLRYIHLNPTRDALCSDPLEWEWSTHRDWVGAIARPGVDRVRWARAMGRRLPSCIDWLHDYVTSDPSVPIARPLVDRTPWLRPHEKDASLEAIASAVPRVLRSGCSAPHEFGAVERRLFLLSAARWTRYRATELARYVGCHRSSALRMVRCEAAVIERIMSGADAIDRTVRGNAIAPTVRRKDTIERTARKDAIDRTAPGKHAIGWTVRGGDAIGQTMDRANIARRRFRAEAARNSRAERLRASGVEPRIRRIPLTADELHAMASMLADPRLSVMPLSADAAEPDPRTFRGRAALRA